MDKDDDRSPFLADVPDEEFEDLTGDGGDEDETGQEAEAALAVEQLSQPQPKRFLVDFLLATNPSDNQQKF